MNNRVNPKGTFELDKELKDYREYRSGTEQ